MTAEAIRAELFRMQDTAYRDFLARLLPTVAPERIIGVRKSYATIGGKGGRSNEMRLGKAKAPLMIFLVVWTIDLVNDYIRSKIK